MRIFLNRSRIAAALVLFQVSCGVRTDRDAQPQQITNSEQSNPPSLKLTEPDGESAAAEDSQGAFAGIPDSLWFDPTGQCGKRPAPNQIPEIVATGADELVNGYLRNKAITSEYYRVAMTLRRILDCPWNTKFSRKSPSNNLQNFEPKFQANWFHFGIWASKNAGRLMYEDDSMPEIAIFKTLTNINPGEWTTNAQLVGLFTAMIAGQALEPVILDGLTTDKELWQAFNRERLTRPGGETLGRFADALLYRTRVYLARGNWEIAESIFPQSWKYIGLLAQECSLWMESENGRDSSDEIVRPKISAPLRDYLNSLANAELGNAWLDDTGMPSAAAIDKASVLAMTRAYDIQNDLSSARTDAPLAIAFAMFRASMFADDLAERKQYLWVANVFTGLHEQMVVQYSLHKALNFYTGRAISVMKNLLHAMVMQGSFPSDFTPETTYPSTVLPETPVTEWIERPGFANFYLTSRLPFQFQVDYRKRNPEKWGGLWSLLIQRGPLGQSVFVSEVLHNKYPAGFAWDNYPTRMQWLAGFFRGLQHSENLEAAPYGGQTISPAGEKRPWECIACPKPEPSPTPQKIAPGQFPLEIKVRDPAESGGTAFFVTAPATKKFVVPLGSMKCDRNLYPGGCVAAKADVQYQLRANVPASDGIFQDFYRWEPAYAKPSSPRLPSSCLSGYPVAPWNSGACQLPKGVLLTRLTAKYRDNSLKVHAEAPVTLPGPMLRTTAIFRDTDTEFRKSCVATSKDEACIHKRAVTVPATQQAIISAQDSFYSGQTQYLFDKWKFLDENGVAIPALEHGMGYFCIDAQRRCIIPSRNAPAQIRPRVRHIIATYKEAPITCQIQILSGGIPNAPIPTTVTLQATYSPRVPSSVYSGGQGIGWTVTVDGTGNSQMGTRRGIYGDFIINQRNSSMSSGRTYTFKHTFGVDPQDFCVTAVVQPPQTIACRLKRGNLLTSNASTFEVYTEFYSMESGTTVTPPPELVTAKPEYWTWSVNGVTQSDNGRAGPRPVTGALYFPTRRFNVNKNTSGMPRNISVQYMTLPGAPYQFECSHTETQPAASSGGGYSSPASGGGGVVTTGSSSAGQNQNPAPGCYGALCECRPKATHTCPPGNRDVLGDGQHYCCP